MIRFSKGKPMKNFCLFFCFCFSSLIFATAWGAENKAREAGGDNAVSALAAASPDGLWQGVSRFTKTSPQQKKAQKPKRKMPRKYRMLELNVKALEAILRRAPDENSKKYTRGVELTLPVADGGYETFKIYQTSMIICTVKKNVMIVCLMTSLCYEKIT